MRNPKMYTQNAEQIIAIVISILYNSFVITDCVFSKQQESKEGSIIQL